MKTYKIALLYLSGLVVLNTNQITAEEQLHLRQNGERKTKAECIEGEFCSVNSGLDLVELKNNHPKMFLGENGDTTTENEAILCPFLRLMERYDIVQNRDWDKSNFTIQETKRGARKLGADSFGVTAVATAVSAGQFFNGQTLPNFVNYEALHTASGIAHDCGLTFGKGETVVSDDARESTLASLADKANNNEGKLLFEDLKQVKLEICDQQGVDITEPGKTEVGLIFTFLGGDMNGYVLLSDVRRFFYGQLPMTVGQPGTFDFGESP